jgi:hypothetical protein
MYLARFSYDVLPVNRQRAVDFIKREVQAARTRACHQLSQTMLAMSWTAARKLRAVFS